MKVLLLLLSIFSACTNNTYQGRDVLDAEEFILDSYHILEEKREISKAYSIRNINPQKKITVCAGLTLLETLSLIKGLQEMNLSKSYLIREGQLFPVNFQNLLETQDKRQDIILQRKDQMYFVENSCVMVLGKVARESIIDISNGSISLKQALVHAGGILASGDKAYIQIFRGNILQPKAYTVHIKHVMHLSEYSMLLLPGDIVYVAAKPFTEWVFVVNQQLPNFIAFDVLKKRASLEITIE